jgi:type VI protein secretion system component Hcp
MTYKQEWTMPELESRGFPKKDAIDSFSWGVVNRGSSWEKGQSGGPAGARDFLVMRKTDQNTHLLFEACATGTRISKVIVYLEKVEGTATYIYLTYTFEDCYISSVHTSGGDTSSDQIAVTFEKMSYEYKKP